MQEKEVIVKIGKENWSKFLEFMAGQTVGLNKDESIEYYEWDVENFLRPKNKRFFD